MDNRAIASLSLLGFVTGYLIWSKIMVLTLGFLSVGTKIKNLTPQAQISVGLRTMLAGIALGLLAFAAFAHQLWHGSPLWARCFFGAMASTPIPAKTWSAACRASVSSRLGSGRPDSMLGPPRGHVGKVSACRTIGAESPL